MLKQPYVCPRVEELPINILGLSLLAEMSVLGGVDDYEQLDGQDYYDIVDTE